MRCLLLVLALFVVYASARRNASATFDVHVSSDGHPYFSTRLILDLFRNSH